MSLARRVWVTISQFLADVERDVTGGTRRTFRRDSTSRRSFSRANSKRSPRPIIVKIVFRAVLSIDLTRPPSDPRLPYRLPPSRSLAIAIASLRTAGADISSRYRRRRYLATELTCSSARRGGAIADAVGAEGRFRARCRRETAGRSGGGGRDRSASGEAGWARRARVAWVCRRSGRSTLRGALAERRRTSRAAALGIDWRSGGGTARTRVRALDFRVARESPFAGRARAFRAGRALAGALAYGARVHSHRRRAVAAARRRLAHAAAGVERVGVTAAAAQLLRVRPEGRGARSTTVARRYPARVLASRAAGRRDRRRAVRVRGAATDRRTADRTVGRRRATAACFSPRDSFGRRWFIRRCYFRFARPAGQTAVTAASLSQAEKSERLNEVGIYYPGDMKCVGGERRDLKYRSQKYILQYASRYWQYAERFIMCVRARRRVLGVRA